MGLTLVAVVVSPSSFLIFRVFLLLVLLCWSDEDGDDEVFAAAAALRSLRVSMMAVAKEADFLRASLLLLVMVVTSAVVEVRVGFCCCCGGCPGGISVLLPLFPVETAADDADALGVSHVFLAALPRTSPTSSAADFFLDLSSSDDRLEDMIVSRVP